MPFEPAPGYRFPRTFRITHQRDFVRALTAGVTGSSLHFRVFIFRQPEPGPTRLGLIVSRRVGNAVLRNRVKRRLREFFRLHRARWVDGVDIVVRAHPGAAQARYADVRDELLKLFEKLGLGRGA